MEPNQIPISIQNKVDGAPPLFDEKVRPWAGMYPRHTIDNLELLADRLQQVTPSCKKLVQLKEIDDKPGEVHEIIVYPPRLGGGYVYAVSCTVDGKSFIREYHQQEVDQL